MLPFSPAADRNKDVILEKLTGVFRNNRRILEIGSGNGQHAVHVTNALPHLVWQCSDLEENVAGISARLDAEGNERTPAPLVIDVATPPRPVPAADSPDAFDGLFTANTLHIMSFAHVEAFFARTGELLGQGGLLCVYGPLKYGGRFTSESNEAFDAQLKSWNPVSGIRDFEALDDLADKAGLSFETDHPMPANNQLVVWQRG
jgi:cyclopropane fatty-acyl-phospholipid synthase-like methyltransferase